MDIASAEDLITSRYAHAYRATPRLDYPRFNAQLCGGRTRAALGYRRGDAGALFLETYLDAPIEAVLAERLGRDFARRDIVEIGSLASCNAPAMIALWARTANDLGSDAEVAVAVLTAPLRAMFRRLAIPLTEIADADPARLGDQRAVWGDYYAQDPLVCAGMIADGQAQLARFSARIARCAA